ncbi:hypothetical protein PT286_08760 [Neisseriaceae bacterium ESL0693]|nr:hypothetical protein [Neisseriaceae bacterium ESL0693]
MGRKKQSRNKAASSMAAPSQPLPKRGSPIPIVIFGLVLLLAGLYLGGWFHLVKPAEMQQCQAHVQRLYPQAADQKVLMPLCRDRHMIEGIAAPGQQRLTVAEIQHSLDVGKRVDMVAMFIGGALIGASIAAFAAAHRAYKRKRGIPDDEE